MPLFEKHYIHSSKQAINVALERGMGTFQYKFSPGVSKSHLSAQGMGPALVQIVNLLQLCRCNLGAECLNTSMNWLSCLIYLAAMEISAYPARKCILACWHVSYIYISL